MGNALRALEDVVYLRTWTAGDVAVVQEALRKRKTLMAIDRATFVQLVGVKSPEAVRVFDDLDTDFDGKVDTFEVLLTLILWSRGTWEEKGDLLFRCFDFNRKGVLRFPELAFMLATASRSLGKFVNLNAGLEDFLSLRVAAADAFGARGETGELAAEGFGAWFGGAQFPQDLRAFVDEHSRDDEGAPEVVEAPVRGKLRMLDYKALEFAQQVKTLQSNVDSLDAETAERDDAQQRKYAVLRKGISAYLETLQRTSETWNSELAELAKSLNEETASASGPASLAEPAARHIHDRLIAEIDVLERKSRADLREASDVLHRMMELTYGTPAEVRPPSSLGNAEADAEATNKMRAVDRHIQRRAQRLEPEQALPASSVEYTRPVPAPVRARSPLQPEVARAPSQLNAAENNVPVDPVSAAEEEPAEDEDQEAMPVVVAFADFDPPPSHETQMLVLRAGDEIMATGQDGQGWWYGVKVIDGTQGWFPPSYVQLKEEVMTPLGVTPAQ